MNNSINLDILQSDIEDVLINHDKNNLGCRIQFEFTYVTFYIYWFDKNNFIKNIGFSFPYTDLVYSNGDLVKRIVDLFDKELSNY